MRGLGVGLDFLPQILDEHTQIIDLIAVIRAPYGLKQLAMRDNLIGMLRKVAQQVQLFWREAGCHVSTSYGPGGEVDSEIAGMQPGRRRWRNGEPAQGGSN